MGYQILTSHDSLVKTILFDVVNTTTGAVVTKNGVTVSPEYDFVLMPSGIGFKQELDLVEGDTIDYVVKQTVKKKEIRLTLAWKGSTAYARYQSFVSWLALYLDVAKYHIRFSYKVGTLRRYVEVSPVNLELIGRELTTVTAELTLKPLTPFYEEYEGTFMLVRDTNAGKIYNYEYPYVYGGGAYSDGNVITNNYLKPLPLKITLRGPMAEPYVSISKLDEDGNVMSTPYLRIQFADGFELTNLQEVVIDAFNNKVYLNTYVLDEDGNRVLSTTVDCFNSVDKNYDTFLFADPGSSRISVALDDETSRCTVTYVRYVL